MNYTIVEFGKFYNENVQKWVETIWTFFRDIANIFIIGMFVFIAISIILGLKEYGQKKLVARILVIAVLINFSLLFTKIIIDGSNFTAKQFYSASGVGTQTGQSGSSASAVFSNDVFSQGQAGVQFIQDGIAGRFIQLMGVTSEAHTFNSLSEGADAIQNGWIILLHGLFGATLLLAAALVLLYGSYLLVVRAVLIIFLLITSALAFASYLAPAKFSTIGWSAWWDSLWKITIFAPLLMIFLFATLQIATGFTPQNGGTLGALIKEPTNSGNLSALFTYVMVIGLLFASIRVSSMFSSSIPGFSIVQSALGNLRTLVGAPLAAGFGLGGYIARRTVGQAGYDASRDIQGQMRAVRRNINLTPEDRAARLAALNQELQTARARAGREYNLNNTWLGKQLAGVTGIGRFGQTRGGGVIGRVQDEARERRGEFEGMALNRQDVRAQENAAVRQAREEAAVTEAHRTAESAEAQHRDARENLRQQRELISQQRQQSQEQISSIERATREQIRAAEQMHSQELEEIRNVVQQDSGELATNPAAERERELRNRLTANEARERILLNERAAAIERARTDANAQIGEHQVNLQQLTRQIEQLNDQEQQSAENARTARERHVQTLNEAETRAREQTQRNIEAFENARNRHIERRAGPRISGEIIDQIEQSSRRRRIGDVIAELPEDQQNTQQRGANRQGI